MSTEAETPEGVSLLQSLDGEWLKLPLAVMQDAGPAVQTLGGLLKIIFLKPPFETFVETEKIAEKARLPLRTAQAHLATLSDRGWINNKGRRRRRTATIALPKRTRDVLEPYAVLPWWASCYIEQHGRLSWGSKAVLSIVMGRLMKLRAAAKRDYDGQDFDLALEEMGGAKRFEFALHRLEEETGLSRKTVIAAKQTLRAAGIVARVAGNNSKTMADVLLPSDLQFEG